MDASWWKMYADDVQKTFKGQRFSNNKQNVQYRVTQIHNINGFGNSGAACVAMALMSGAKKIVLLGYDCQKTNGKAHWHGNHPKGLGNAKNIDRWQEKFADLAKFAKENMPNTQIINASRLTALDMFERMDLEHALA
jgi:uncharacterized Rossmann fold enzyme